MGQQVLRAAGRDQLVGRHPKRNPFPSSTSSLQCRAIVLLREIAHIKCQRMGINDKKKTQKRQEKQKKITLKRKGKPRSEARKTKRTKLTANWQPEAGRGGRTQNWNEMPCQSIWLPLTEPHHTLPLAPSHTSGRSAVCPRPRCPSSACYQPRPNNVRLSISATSSTQPTKRVKMFHCARLDNICQ